jgi:hypothetical protein
MISRLVIAPIRALVVIATFPTHSALGAPLPPLHAPAAAVVTAHNPAPLPAISTRLAARVVPLQGAEPNLKDQS